MAYDVDKRPGAWVGTRAWRELRLAAFGTVVALVLAVLSFLLSVSAGLVSVLLVVFAFVMLRAANRRLDSYENWDKGHRAEEAVGLELEKLRYEGFIVMHDIDVGAGNIDHLVRGPTGVFLIETKHKGYRLSSLGLAVKNAVRLRKELGVWVTVVVCKATADYGPRPHRRAWVMGKNQLLDWIRAQNNPPGDFDSFARWADGL